MARDWTPSAPAHSAPTSPSTPAASLARLLANIERALFGKREAVTMATVALVAEGHVLLEDVPGTGKTTLARALARSVDASFSRIQFTSDLLPSDVLGLSTPDPRTGELVFRHGPVFANVVLADELNRTPPRVQSAMLQAMDERRVTIEGQRHALPRPFLVIATQNPLEFEGTYPLPESQLDRFLLRIRIGYPDRVTERAVLLDRARHDPLEELAPVISLPELEACTERARKVRLEDELLDYLLDLIEATRDPELFQLGASPRAAIALQHAAQALALLEGRDYCIPDDLKRLSVPVLAHRLVPHPSLLASTLSANAGPTIEEQLRARLEQVPTPT